MKNRFSVPIINLLNMQEIKSYKIMIPGMTRITEEKTRSKQVASILFEGQGLQVTDGHHTMDELYAHRHELFITLIRWVTTLEIDNLEGWKSKLHADGTMFENWFIAGITMVDEEKETHITYHLPIHLWDACLGIEYEKAPEWDGHDSVEVLKRLRRL